jgi:pSer/pThr/pTyr-binding forkhead associated (FHA) protein
MGAMSPTTGIALVWQQRILALSSGENIAGRGAECSVVIEATTVSRRHARIMVSSGGATIEDLQSTNGTYINKRAISTPTSVNDGDEIAFGTAELTVRIANPSAPTVIDLPRRKTASSS